MDPGDHEFEAFGDRGGYWEKYDKLAEDHDKHMLKQLDNDLDNLLIFVRSLLHVSSSLVF